MGNLTLRKSPELKRKTEADKFAEDLAEGLMSLGRSISRTTTNVASGVKNLIKSLQSEATTCEKQLSITKTPIFAEKVGVKDYSLLIARLDYDAFCLDNTISWKQICLSMLKGLNDSELNAMIETFSTWPSQVQFAFVKCIPTILLLKEYNGADNIYYSIPVPFAKFVVDTYRYCNPIVALGAIDFPISATDEIMRRYITMSGETFPVLDFIWWFIRKLYGIQWFSINTTYLLFVWMGMLAELSKSDIYSNAFTKISRATLSLFVLSIQVYNREVTMPATVLKSLYTKAASITDIIKKLPTEWKSKFTKMLNLPENDNASVIVNHEILNWHMDLGILSRRPGLSMGGAFNMVYTYRIGHEYLLAPPNSWESFVERFKLSMNTLIPFPWPQEAEDIKRLYLSEDASYDQRVNEIYSKYYSKLSSESIYNSILNCGAHIYKDITKLNIAYNASCTYYIDEQHNRRFKKDDTLIFYISCWLKERGELNSLNGIEKDRFAYDLSRYIDSNILATHDLIKKLVEI